MITFQCNPGFSPEGGMTTTCTNAGVWSPDPAGVECFYNSECLMLITECCYSSIKSTEFVSGNLP